MPALITHNLFGCDMLERMPVLSAFDNDERDAFLLGNQGPDPLFYLVVGAPLNARKLLRLGSTMHRDNADGLLAAMRKAADALPPEVRSVGLAYTLGFLCHYTLDSTMHPFVYAQQFAVCDAGIEGIGPEDGNDVHSEIERRFDEMVLYRKKGVTVRSYRPYREVLTGSSDTLAVIDAVYSMAMRDAYGLDVPKDLYTQAVRRFRFAQRAFYSPSMRVHAIAGGIERNVLGRNHSFYAALAHRVTSSPTCAFDNRERATWANPFTNELSDQGFWDLYGLAQEKAERNIGLFLAEGFDEHAAHEITQGQDFSGDPTHIGR